LGEFTRGKLQYPIITSSVPSPYSFGISKYQKLCGILAPDIILDVQGLILPGRDQLFRRDQDASLSRFRIIANDIMRTLTGGRAFQCGIALLFLEPSGWAETIL
jgi:hypothetical protein